MLADLGLDRRALWLYLSPVIAPAGREGGGRVHLLCGTVWLPQGRPRRDVRRPSLPSQTNEVMCRVDADDVYSAWRGTQATPDTHWVMVGWCPRGDLNPEPREFSPNRGKSCGQYNRRETSRAPGSRRGALARPPPRQVTTGDARQAAARGITASARPGDW